MKATHNINIDGTWYRAGEELPEAEQVEAELTVTEPEEPVAEPQEEAKPEKPKTTRRKKLSE